MRQPTAKEISRCMDEIAKADARLGPKGTQPAKIWVLEFPESTSFYVDFVNPKTLAIGEIYVTWVVTISPSGEVKVATFRSRRGTSGDDTIPPE